MAGQTPRQAVIRAAKTATDTTAKENRTLARVPLLRSLDANAIKGLNARCTWKTATPKQWLIEHQDEGNDVFFLVRGRVRVLIVTSPDREVILADIQTGDYFGELAAIDGKTRSAGIVALTSATVAAMPAKVFQEVFRKYPDVAEQLLMRLALRVREMTQRIYEFNALNVKHRIYAELLRLSHTDPTNNRQAIVSPPPSHAEIAARVSTRREMVSRELKSLERAGLMGRRRGALVLADVDALMARLALET
ncbi:MAG: Crp/Fnr family transcriptional regulator [Xanthobacteraceae bacterium]